MSTYVEQGLHIHVEIELCETSTGNSKKNSYIMHDLIAALYNRTERLI